MKKSIRTSWIYNDDTLWETAFAFGKEFGWTVHYVIYEVPLPWIKKLSNKIIECAEAQKEAAKGRRPIPQSEFSDENMEYKNRRLAEATGQDYDEILSKSVYG